MGAIVTEADVDLGVQSKRVSRKLPPMLSNTGVGKMVMLSAAHPVVSSEVSADADCTIQPHRAVLAVHGPGMVASLIQLHSSRSQHPDLAVNHVHRSLHACKRQGGDVP